MNNLRFAMPSAAEPQFGQKPSPVRTKCGGTSSLAARVPLAGAPTFVPPKPVRGAKPTQPTARQPSAGYDSERPCGVENLPALCHPEFDLDPTCPTLCAQCNLPLGDHVYAQGAEHVHGECMAQLLLQGLREGEDKRNQEDEEVKLERRKEFDIGWKHSCVPRNTEMQAKLQLDDAMALDGMCCLAVSADSESVGLAATAEPLAAINLEYLSIALQVRRTEGGEPRFSLDPTKAADALEDEDCKHKFQVKRFIPEWLAGTSVGEVLFQADYHLKELSMGEHAQPVVGMKSCFDYFQEGSESTKKWSGREWFMVRQAGVHLSEDGVLIPVVKMGVEAREQLLRDGAMIDAPITRSSHPMVKYADSFTKNFDLIAERKSVIYQLRELAKASVMAKYLMESCTQVDESWFNLVGEEELACALEVPQLWNERMHSNIRVEDGKILNCDNGNADIQGIYGGVDFGLSKFAVSRPAAQKFTTSRPAALGQKLGVSLLQVAGLAKLQMGRGGPTEQIKASIKATMLRSPGLIAPVLLMPEGVPAVDVLDLPRFRRVRPSMLRAIPGLEIPTQGFIAPPEMPSALERMKLECPPISQAVAYSDPRALATAEAEVAKGPVIMPRVAAARRGLLSGGVLARGPIPATVSVAPMEAPARITTQAIGGPAAPAVSFAMPGQITPGFGMAPATLSGMAMSAQPAAAIQANFAPGLVTRMAARPAGILGQAPSPAASLQGVDLSLNQFSLDATEPAEGKWICEPQSGVDGAELADAFWSCLDDEQLTEGLTGKLLKNVFNPHLSDRRAEGSCFTAPDTSDAYICKLETLLKEEEEIRQQRKDHFFSTSFRHDSPGSLFPITWTPVAGTKPSEQGPSPGGLLQARTDFEGAAAEILKSAVPAFHKKTEEGLNFRIYQVGSLEVRTIQEHDGEEVVGAVFSVKSAAKAFRCSGGHEKIDKVTEYVHKVHGSDSKEDFQYYVVFKTENGNTILSEQLADGMVTWEENQVDLEVRNGLAKVIRFADCKVGVAVQDMKLYREQMLNDSDSMYEHTKHGQRYATNAYALAAGL